MTASSLPLLRPLGIGELLDQAIRQYRRSFLTFIGILAVVQIPLALLQFGVALLTLQSVRGVIGGAPVPTDNPLAPPFSAATIGTLFITLISFLLVQGVATAAMTRAVSDNYLGAPTGFTGAYRRIGRDWLPLIGTLIIAGFIGLLLGIWFIIPCVGWATGLGLLAFFGGVIVPLAAPVVVLEHKRGYGALRRGWDLARRRFWPVVGFVTLLYIFSLIIVSGPNLIISVIFQSLIGAATRTGQSAASLVTVQAIVQSLTTLVFSLLYVPLQLIGVTLLYFDLRVRTEGLDLAMLTQAAPALAAPSAAAEAATTQAPPAEHGGLITLRELGYFFLISLVFFVLYAVLVFGLIALIGIFSLGVGGGVG
jgi:hypothetical protein